MINLEAGGELTWTRAAAASCLVALNFLAFKSLNLYSNVVTQLHENCMYF